LGNPFAAVFHMAIFFNPKRWALEYNMWSLSFFYWLDWCLCRIASGRPLLSYIITDRMSVLVKVMLDHVWVLLTNFLMASLIVEVVAWS
jgi:hypothetical protein